MTDKQAGYLTVTEREWLKDGKRFVAAWVDHANSFWAWHGLSTLCQLEPEEAWRSILLLVEKAPSDGDLVTVGLNPLTDLLIAHGPRVIDRIEAEAARSRRFRLCLREMYQSDDDPDIQEEVWARIKALQDGVA